MLICMSCRWNQKQLMLKLVSGKVSVWRSWSGSTGLVAVTCLSAGEGKCAAACSFLLVRSVSRCGVSAGDSFYLTWQTIKKQPALINLSIYISRWITEAISRRVSQQLTFDIPERVAVSRWVISVSSWKSWWHSAQQSPEEGEQVGPVPRTIRPGSEPTHNTAEQHDTRLFPCSLWEPVSKCWAFCSDLQHIHVVLGGVQQGVALIMSHIFKRTSPCRLIIPELGEIQRVCWGSRSSAGQQWV